MTVRPGSAPVRRAPVTGHPAGQVAVPRVLLVAYHFPPQGGGGVQRPAKLVRAWSDAGVPVAVLSSLGHPFSGLDPSLVDEVPQSVRREVVPDRSPVLRLNALRKKLDDGLAGRLGGKVLALLTRIAEGLSIPDPFHGWIPAAVRAGRELAHEFRPTVILATAPPFTGFVVGQRLARTLDLPLVLDYRDPWTANYLPGVTVVASRLRRRFGPGMEARALASASGVVTAHRAVFRHLRDRPALAKHLGSRLWVPNGYDPADFTEGVVPDPSRFTLSYAGTFYRFRSPRFLFEAIDDLLAAGDLDPEKFQIRLAGDPETFQRNVEVSERVQRVLTFEGYLPHRDSVRLLQQSTVNVVLEGTTGRRNEHSPGKFYEVLYASRPLLLLCPEGTTTHLGRRAGGCSIVPPDDRTAIRQALGELYRRWADGESLRGPDRDRLRFYDRNHQAMRLLRFIRRVSG